jgi:hypothetical protein
MNTYEEYAILDAKIKELTDKKNALRVKVLEEMIESKQTKVITTTGTFTTYKSKSWVLPEYISDMEDEVKAAVEKAKSTGEATYIESDSLKFTSVKL